MDLTVCTVCYNSASEIIHNVELAERLNPEDSLRWIVTENSPQESTERLTAVSGNVTLLPSIPRTHTPHFHHTIGLTRAILEARTRFILVIDPDFFIVMPEWLRALVGHMRSRELAMLGVPWHPLRTDKYRYFPAVHCTLFDTQYLAKERIDFKPDYPDGDEDPNWPNGFVEHGNYFSISPVSRVVTALGFFRHRRTFYIDTGGRMYKAHVGRSEAKYECLEPVYDHVEHNQSLSRTTRLLELMLPDDLCYVPKRYKHNPDLAFVSRYLNESAPKHWEEFLWKGTPFGFHMRRNLKAGERSAREERELALKIVRSLAEEASRPTSQAGKV